MFYLGANICYGTQAATSQKLHRYHADTWGLVELHTKLQDSYRLMDSMLCNRASVPQIEFPVRNWAGMLPGEYQNQPSGRPGGPFRFCSREQSGPKPAQKPDLRPRRIIAEHRGLERREGQH